MFDKARPRACRVPRNDGTKEDEADDPALKQARLADSMDKYFRPPTMAEQRTILKSTEAHESQE